MYRLHIVLSTMFVGLQGAHSTHKLLRQYTACLGDFGGTVSVNLENVH